MASMQKKPLASIGAVSDELKLSIPSFFLDIQVQEELRVRKQGSDAGRSKLQWRS
jgi:hypothetical protein